MPISFEISNLKDFDKAIADYAKATHRSLDYSALRAARNWVIQASRLFRKFGKDAKPVNLMDGSHEASRIVAHRLRLRSEKGLLPVDAKTRTVNYVKGKRTRSSQLSRGAKYYTVDYAREYARKATRYPYSRRGFVRVLPWKITSQLDAELAKRGEVRAGGRKAQPPPARKRHAGEIHMAYSPATKRLTLQVSAVYDYKSGYTLAMEPTAPGVRKMNADMQVCMMKVLPAVVKDIQAYVARKLRKGK